MAYLSEITAIPVDGSKTTYSCSIAAMAASSTAPTDIFTIFGSATKTIRVTRIAFAASQTTAAQRDVLVIKRSSLNTGGTSTTPLIMSHDSTNPASTALVRAYTANPTLGGTSGTVRASKVYIGTSTGDSDEFVMDFGTRPSQAIVIRGINECLSINLNGITSNGSSISMSIEWTEE